MVICSIDFVVIVIQPDDEPAAHDQCVLAVKLSKMSLEFPFQGLQALPRSGSVAHTTNAQQFVAPKRQTKLHLTAGSVRRRKAQGIR